MYILILVFSINNTSMSAIEVTGVTYQAANYSSLDACKKAGEEASMNFTWENTKWTKLNYTCVPRKIKD